MVQVRIFILIFLTASGMISQISSRYRYLIPTNIKNEFQTIAKKNGSNISVKTCELIVDYINKNKECSKNERN